jgi:hypothetical protein
MTKNYKVLDMPSMLKREVVKQDPLDSTIWIRDDSWYEDIKEIYGAFATFLTENNLLVRPIGRDLDSLVIWLDDLDDSGRALIASGALGRWLDSFDRPGSKKSLSDTRYLQKALQKLG